MTRFPPLRATNAVAGRSILASNHGSRHWRDRQPPMFYSCGAAIDEDGWTAERLCQMCWEGYCGDKFWEIAMSVEQMVEQLHQLMAEHCFVQAQELAEDIDADERATPEQRTTAGEYLQQIMRNEEAYSWGYDQ